jgi:hypothetical protein
VSATLWALNFNPVFSNSCRLVLVFDGVVALFGPAQCLLFVQIQALTQARPLPDADSAVWSDLKS